MTRKEFLKAQIKLLQDSQIADDYIFNKISEFKEELKNLKECPQKEIWEEIIDNIGVNTLPSWIEYLERNYTITRR